jgi:hypothetical protein
MKFFRIHIKGKADPDRVEGDTAREVRATDCLAIRKGREIIASYPLAEIQGWTEEVRERSDASKSGGVNHQC